MLWVGTFPRGVRSDPKAIPSAGVGYPENKQTKNPSAGLGHLQDATTRAQSFQVHLRS